MAVAAAVFGGSENAIALFLANCGLTAGTSTQRPHELTH